MNPTEIGTFEELEDATSSEQSEAKISSSNQSETAISSSSSSSSEDGDSSEESDVEIIEEEEKEDMLLRQKFLADSDVTVGQILKENDMDIIDFVRLECGETQKEIQ
ncbi:Elongation factor Ts, mitochondrial [Armadillidium vulgare]|nr:Elongation factor Ts, mitochondrial [Armadillidium vulgare]